MVDQCRAQALAHTHTVTMHAPATQKHDLHLLPLVALSLYAVPYRGEQLYDTHDDALIPNADRMRRAR